MSTTATRIRQISLVCVPTIEQDRAITFYESLGFEKRTDIPMGPDYRWVEVYPPEGPTGVALAPPPPSTGEVVPTMTGITLTTSDIDATHARFKELRRRRRRRGVSHGRSGPAAVLVPGHDGPHADGRGAALSASRPQADPDFTGLVERHRAELHAHCYRMLGSVHDADDAVQETVLRAWRGAAGLREAASARGWLYAIATNVCLTELARRRRRMLPQDFGPAAPAHTPPGAPVTESAWLEPYPDEPIGLPDGRATPEATYEQHEGVELAFVAALQHLGANQRAVLLLREVMGFSAQESAAILETSVASVNSALQRARAAVQGRVPARTQQATLRALGDRGLRELVGRYVDAWERCDVDAFAALLVEDASFAMPPLSTWYTPRDAIADWARAYSLSGAWRWRTV